MPLGGFDTRAVSTHSRLKAAGQICAGFIYDSEVSTHSRPKAAGSKELKMKPFITVSTHSRPKAAEKLSKIMHRVMFVSTHSRPKAAAAAAILTTWTRPFQHTAARRRLKGFGIFGRRYECFNTQPPEGGWQRHPASLSPYSCFNTQPPEGGWLQESKTFETLVVSTHSRPKAADCPVAW